MGAAEVSPTAKGGYGTFATTGLFIAGEFQLLHQRSFIYILMIFGSAAVFRLLVLDTAWSSYLWLLQTFVNKNQQNAGKTLCLPSVMIEDCQENC